MIYTLTLNPAVDYVVHVESLRPGRIMRSVGESIFFGGKGINVSTVLKELGVKSVAMGFLGGFTGLAINGGLADSGIDCDFVFLDKGFTRINVKIRSDVETDVNGMGPEIDPAALSELMDKLSVLKEGDILVLAGSVPKSLPGNVYEMIMDSLYAKGVKFVVDAAGGLLLSSLKFRPFLIKPNCDELGEIFSCVVETAEDAVGYAKKLRNMGAENVIVSMGEKGAVLVDSKDNVRIAPAYKGKTLNTVGAGDSMVAGFLAGYEKTSDLDYSLKLGTAAGSATAFCEGLAKRADIEALVGEL